jgi:hypothetical protein
MLTQFEQYHLTNIRKNLLGVELETNINGNAGRDFENKLENLGYYVNRSFGIDLPMLGWEVKTRKESAISAQTITSMHPDDIVKTPYMMSPVYEKFKKQLRVYTNDGDIIIKIDVFDFDKDIIQTPVKASYENARKILISNRNINYIPYKGLSVYFEKTRHDRPELDIRLSTSTMQKFESMSRSMYNHLFY